MEQSTIKLLVRQNNESLNFYSTIEAEVLCLRIRLFILQGHEIVTKMSMSPHSKCEKQWRIVHKWINISVPE